MFSTMEYPGVSRWATLVRAEYQEMPGLNLTRKQMERLWGFDSATCDALIAALTDAQVLRRTRDGSYVAFQSAH